MSVFQARREKLAALLQAGGYDAAFLQTPVSLGYFLDFAEDAHERFMTCGINTQGEYHLICPALSENQARRAGVENLSSWRDGEDPLELFKELADKWNLRRKIALVDDHLPAKMLLEMQEAIPAALFKPAGAVLAGVMRSKDALEQERMHKAGAIVDECYKRLQKELKEGWTEIQIRHFLEDGMRSQGGTPLFCAVAIDAAAAEPHHMVDHTPVKHGSLVLVDFGCTYEGYCSDITRSFAFGKINPEHAEAYKLVYAAHIAGRDFLANRGDRAVSGADVDAAARKVIEDAGFGEYFNHRLGHGIGTQVHEHPYISSDNKDPLLPGDCFSIEPGVYLADKYGIRIENLYVLTESGVTSFNEGPDPELIVVGG